MGFLYNPYWRGENFSNNIFTQMTPITLTNTAVETSLIGTGVGTNVFSPNFFTEGKSVEVRASGYISGVNNHTATIRIYLGAVKLIESVATMPTSFTNTEFELTFLLTSLGNNLFIGQGKTSIYAGVAFSTVYSRPLLMLTESTVDTTLENEIDLTYQWGTASTSDSVTVTNCVINSIR